jgi:hypothetical protein
MDIDRYVSELQTQLAAAAEIGDPEARAVAERLSGALDAAARLTVLGVLSDVASEITREIAPGSVDVVLRGRDPHLVVSRPAEPAPAAVPSAAPEPQDDATSASPTSSRTTLRLPDRLKARAEQAAAAEGVSVNTWFVRAISAALEPGAARPAAPQRDSKQGDRFIGWAR